MANRYIPRPDLMNRPITLQMLAQVSGETVNALHKKRARNARSRLNSVLIGGYVYTTFNEYLACIHSEPITPMMPLEITADIVECLTLTAEETAHASERIRSSIPDVTESNQMAYICHWLLVLMTLYPTTWRQHRQFFLSPVTSEEPPHEHRASCHQVEN